MGAVHDVQLNCVARSTLSVNSQFLLEVIPVRVVERWTNVPRPELLAVDAVKVNVSNESGPVVFGEIGSVLLSPGFVLDLLRRHKLGERRQSTVFDVGPSMSKGGIVQAKESSKNADCGHVLVHDVLICAAELVG